MAHSQQKLHYATFNKLKSLSNLDEIRFDEKPLTAILGPNGCGKSTILHALACCYKPLAGSTQPNYKFKDFFTPNTDATWAGSDFMLEHSYREHMVDTHVERYRKDEDRWAPKYERRPERHVALIGIRSCVPKIEEETYTSMIRYETQPHADQMSNTIRGHMSTVFNRRYDELNSHRAGKKRYSGLAHNGTRYSSLSMGAGEQRVLNLLTQVFNAPRYGLILVDEIDLLLHTDALKKLLGVLANRAEEKSLQIVFTTHRETVLEMTHIVSIRHIFQTPGRTFCFNNTKPDAIRRLTGMQHRPLEIFVEDRLASAIVEFELSRANIKRHTSLATYGAATNLFTLAAGLAMNGLDDFSSALFLQDGDLYATADERRTRLDKVFSGNEPATERRKAAISASISKLVSETQSPPEVELHQMICELDADAHPEHREVIELAKGIQAVDDTHSLIRQIVHVLDVSFDLGHTMVVAAATCSMRWPDFVAELRNWIEQRRQRVLEAAQ